MKNICFIALVLLFLSTGCSSKEDKLSCNVKYDVRIPQNLLKVADVYAEYEDNGQVHTERLSDGRFEKSFSYMWKDDDALASHPGFTSLKIYLRQKVATDQLSEGMQLLKDANAYMSATGNYVYNHDKDNAWTGSSTSSSSSGEVGGTYRWSDDAQDYAYTVEEQVNYFSSQDATPYFYVKFDHVGSKLTATLSGSGGQPEKSKSPAIIMESK